MLIGCRGDDVTWRHWCRPNCLLFVFANALAGCWTKPTARRQTRPVPQ